MVHFGIFFNNIANLLTKSHTSGVKSCIPLWYNNDLNANVLQKFPEERPLYLEVDNADVFRVGGAGVMDKHFVRIWVKLPKHLVKKFDCNFVPAKHTNYG